MQKVRYVGLDILRVFLASYVFFFHAWGRLVGWETSVMSHEIFRKIPQILQYGFLGVDIFFIISGFAIASTLSDSINFIDKRLKRLIPSLLFVGVAELLLVTFLILTEKTQSSFFTEILNQTLGILPTSGNDVDLRNFVVWSLTIELQFYFLFLMYIIMQKYLRNKLVSFIYIWITLLYVSQYWNIIFINEIIIRDFAIYFIVGIAIYLYKVGGINNKNGFLWMILIAPQLVKTLNSRIGGSANLGPSWLPWFIIGIILLFLFLSVKFPLFSRGSFSHKLKTLGQASYPFYLLGGFFGMTLLAHVHSEMYFSDNRLAFLVPTFVVYAVIFLLSTFYTKYLDEKLIRIVFRYKISTNRGPRNNDL